MKNNKLPAAVFDLVKTIPKGRVATYGAIAQLIKLKSPRSVGQILHRNPDPQTIPCHRVVFADGSLSANYAFGGAAKQKEKLRREGIIFRSNGKVDLRRFRHSSKSFSSFFKEAT